MLRMLGRERSFEPGTLRERIRQQAEQALASGALVPIATETAVMPDGGIEFQVRVASSLRRKDRSDREQARTGRNPFLPYDPALFVADVSETHVALLNKFSVFDDHVLIVSREFEDQELPLGRADFEALARCLVEVEGLGFYNSGEIAGASQRHRHLQVVPFPLGAGTDPTPIHALLVRPARESGVARAPGLPFPHAIGWIDSEARVSAERVAARLHEIYADALSQLGLPAEAPGPYNLLATREWALVVPRSLEASEGISVNALGFAGSLLVKSRSALTRVREVGPLELLRRVSSAPRLAP
jgi:ATP adenylyltransferase